MAQPPSSAEMIRSPEAAANFFFMKSLKEHRLPEKLDADTVLEVLTHPHHFPVVQKLLALFGKSSQTNSTTELKATHCDPKIAGKIAKRYAIELKTASRPKRTAYPRLHSQSSARLQTLAASYEPGWEWRGLGQKIFYLLGEVFAEPLGYDLKAESTDGDYHLIVDWIVKNMDKIEPIFFNQGSLESVTARIAHSKSVAVDQPTLDGLLHAWDDILGAVDLEEARIKKPVAPNPNTKEAFPRTGETSISRDFRELFVDLDLTDVKAVAEYLAIDPDDLNEEDMAYLTRQVNVLHLTMLGLMQNADTENQPLEQLTAQLEEPLDQILPLLLEAISTAPSAQGRSDQLRAFDASLGNRNLKQVITSLIEKTPGSSYPGFGAARALLTRYTELRLKNHPDADKIEKLMHNFTQLVRGVDTKIDLKLEEFTQNTG
jgi:hypothetical protein